MINSRRYRLLFIFGSIAVDMAFAADWGRIARHDDCINVRLCRRAHFLLLVFIFALRRVNKACRNGGERAYEQERANEQTLHDRVLLCGPLVCEAG